MDVKKSTPVLRQPQRARRSARASEDLHWNLAEPMLKLARVVTTVGLLVLARDCAIL
jgi:hypothetical protein